jgi:hypothetical protein
LLKSALFVKKTQKKVFRYKISVFCERDSSGTTRNRREATMRVMERIARREPQKKHAAPKVRSVFFFVREAARPKFKKLLSNNQ